MDYRLALVLPDGSAPPPALTVVDGTPSLYVTAGQIFEGPPLGRLAPQAGPITVPADRYTAVAGLSEGTRLVPTLMTLPKPYCHGEVFKVRISNHGDDVANSRPLRISQITLLVQDQDSEDPTTRRERVD